MQNIVVEEKKRSVKENLRTLHLYKNIIDSNEYSERMKQVEKYAKEAPEKLDQIENFEVELSPSSKIPHVSALVLQGFDLALEYVHA